MSQNIGGPEFGAGPKNFNKVQVNGIFTLHQVRALFLQTNEKTRQVTTCCVYCRAGRDFVH